MTAGTETLVATPDEGVPSSRNIETGIEDAELWANLGSEAVHDMERVGLRGYEPRSVSPRLRRDIGGLAAYHAAPPDLRIMLRKPHPPIFRAR